MTEPALTAKENPIVCLYRIIQGALIGGGAILPGVSGGVLAVVFGIYRPMMAFLSRPIKTFQTHYRLFIPIIIGVVLGFWGFAKLVDWMFSGSSPIPLSLFIGLILGTLPMLYKAAQKPRDGHSLTQPERTRNHLALIISFVSLMVFLVLISGETNRDLQPTLLWSFVSGIIWGLSLVVPGLSSSSILLFLGIYVKIMAGVKDLDFSIILPLLLGIALIAFLCARLIDRMFLLYHGIASNAVVGLVAASTLAIVIVPPPEYAITSLGQGVICLFVAIAGFVAAHYLGKWGEKIKPAEDAG